MASATRVVRAKGADQRDRVLAAAIDVIAERGPHRATVRDIATKAGISPSHVLYYFGKRENILIETLRWSESQLSIQRAAILPASDDAWVNVQAFVALYLPEDARDVRWNLWNQVIAAPPLDAQTQETVARLEQAWVDDLSNLLQRGADSGEFRAIDAPALALQTRFFMDGVSSEVILGLPGRDAAWGKSYVCDWLAMQLAVHRG